MSFLDKLLGRSLTLRAGKKQSLSVITGIPVLGLDALASTAYGPEAALMILLPLGMVGLHYFLVITLCIIIVLLSLYFSYMQTAKAYPEGGGAYIVAKDNLGKKVGLWAGIALLIDYLLNVAVGISAGIGAIVSAIPPLHPYTLPLCLIVLFILTILNLRGVRDTGLVFVVPTLVFILCIGISMIIGLIQTWQSGGHPQSIIAPPSFPIADSSLSIWLLLGAFSNGLTAMTGVEAVSNAIPLFQKPSVKNAQWTLTIIVGILGLFLLFIGYLCPVYHIVAMDESQPGYQTIYSQLIAAITGKGIFYYISIASIFIILTNSAQTSFADFPRVCRLLAEDHFLPHFFAERGRRLVFSLGIIFLAIFSAILLIIFKGITNNLIPLFAVGAFSAFLFSQIGMIVHWLHNKDAKNAGLKLACNAAGAIVTAMALIVIIITKFIQGAWIVVFLAPMLTLLLIRIRHHYKEIIQETEKPIELQVSKLQSPTVIIPIRGWNRVTEQAVRFGLQLSDDVTVLHVSFIAKDDENLRKIWVKHVEKPLKVLGIKAPNLEIIYSPYRKIYKPILSFIKKMKREKSDNLIAIIIPELIEAHWYEHLLHNVRAAGLRTLLLLERDQRTVVISIPWYMH